MWLLAAPLAAVYVLVGGFFMKWSVHVTHMWWSLVPEIPYGTACLAVFVTSLGALVLFLISAALWSLFD